MISRGMWAYHAAVFLSAFLLFQVQLMLSKALLPGFGGSYLVWGACMVFFQGMLVVGYVYAHFIQKHLGVYTYARWHWLALALPLIPLLFAFPFDFARLASPRGGGLPLAADVFMLLASVVLLPFFALATTSLILQRWLSVSDLPERDNPYVLYSASNAGSILALLTYPTLVEPFLALDQQGVLWWVGYVILIALHAACRPRSGSAATADAGAAAYVAPARSQALRWFLLSTAGSAALLAVTNMLTFDLAAVPFLWVLPLATYLLTFVLTFKRRRWFPRWTRLAMGWVVPVGILVYVMAQFRLALPPAASLAFHLAVLFVVCLNCHGVLIGQRPADPGQLTAFYIVLSLGGVAGSILVSWALPVVSQSLVEVPGMYFLAVLALALAETGPGERETPAAGSRPSLPALAAWTLGAALLLTLAPHLLRSRATLDPRLGFVILAVPLLLGLRRLAPRPLLLAPVLLVVAVATNWTEQFATGGAVVERLRNFYGIYKVYDFENERYLQHGTTEHGRQSLAADKADVPMAYFHPSTPAGQILDSRRLPFSSIGMIGLGTGALVRYGRPGQDFAIFELDPDNERIARKRFSYIDRSRANLRFAFGDGRVCLRDEPDAIFDLFILDAFSSGAIPVHLLTTEAVEEYFRVLSPGGLALLHISNKVLDLQPVVYSVAQSQGLHACVKTNEGQVHEDADLTFWIALCRDDELFRVLTTEFGWTDPHWRTENLPRPWTDKFSNVFGAMF